MKSHAPTVFITGASSGIGLACAHQFAAIKYNLVIGARRIERLEKIADEIANKYGVNVIPIPLDVQRVEQVEEAFRELKSQKVNIDILVNNAGLALSSDKMQDAKISNWEIMIDTNLKGLLYMTKAVLPQMIERDHGHIINIGSIAGHGHYVAGNVYSATKHAVRAISKSLRIDLMGTKIRVSEVDPGLVETEFSEVRWNDKDRAKKLYQGYTPLIGDDIADAVVYCATRPPHVNIAEIVIFPQAQASITDIYKKGDTVKSLFDTK